MTPFSPAEEVSWAPAPVGSKALWPYLSSQISLNARITGRCSAWPPAPGYPSLPMLALPFNDRVDRRPDTGDNDPRSARSRYPVC